MTYNVRSCRGMDGRTSPERVAEVIERFNPDVVALQELDHKRRRSGHLDQTGRIAEILTMDSHFHPALRIEDEEYGEAVLSKHPMSLVKAGALPSLPRQFIPETRGALWVEVTVNGTRWQIINTHFGLGRAERRVQAAAILGPEWVGQALGKGPLIVCGDFNSPARRVVHTLFTSVMRDAQLAVNGGAIKNTFATSIPFICLDYVFVSEGVHVASAEVPRTPLTRITSDHFPLIVELSAGGPAPGG